MSFSYISKYEQTRLWKFITQNKPLNYKDSVQELYMLKKYLYGFYNPRRRIPLQNCLTSEGRSKLACIMPNARDNGDNCHTSEHQRCVPRWNPRWSERSEWNLGYESQRIIAHRRCRLTSTRERNIVADRTHLRSSLVFTRHHPTFAALHVGIRRGPHLWCSLV